MYKEHIKKLFDFMGAIIALIVLSPLLFVVYITLYITTKDSVIYHQQRVGQYGVIFEIYKKFK